MERNWKVERNRVGGIFAFYFVSFYTTSVFIFFKKRDMYNFCTLKLKKIKIVPEFRFAPKHNYVAWALNSS